ncbi:MAG: undecaprenyldiphospho-muramoylpentapeptide beta-N-acetylglucosaminyltransferase [Thiomicrorhabdus chilensis]|uniref:undecaprenyldiphospho-muramoylpentapeptide beta-N-acetylglucosaminyltransferase n=1 Tax=Thiomicrorhabdus chilensis TaxID=63656 RepID=UPI00299F3E53|nr:undecaprenyldiphospho-muramoylpentapeptide beta-N-acetylglucosaminyltransferase [Thiomicrorhabdus chilensis]MDX1346686.1 undecaprenyldiphospho-muramoylpentapeptide beta-N-acetylglucosaminyltransferase [Thiomicrorhabdus chilensis]
MKSQKTKVCIMAGGTGGHVFPGIAIAEELQDHDVEVCWMGTQGGMERDWVERAMIPFKAISVKGLRGNGLIGWLKAPINVTRACWQARAILREQKPDLVLGMGGFVCGPGGLAAKTLGIPLVVHEQNAIPGLTNKLLAPLAAKVITAFPQSRIHGEHVERLGNPVRAGLEELSVVAEHTPCRLLVLGGSRGALALNETVPKALALLPEEIRPKVIHQTGEKTLNQAQKAYGESGVKAEVVPFIDDMRQAYEAADMVICRSGALTVSELMATARPAIMVPYPHAVDDHQTANAQVLVDLDGGEIIQQNDLTASGLALVLKEWCETPQKRMAASQNIRSGAPSQATQKIAKLLLAIIKAQG